MKRLNSILRGIVVVAFIAHSSLSISVPALTVKDSQVLIGGSPGSVAGNSLFWSNAAWNQDRFYNKEVVSWLKRDWQAGVIRAAMAVEAPGGLLQDKAGNMKRVTTVIDAAIDNDMYVIVDFHTHHAHKYEPHAIEFFTEMATRYGNHRNIIYEIYNEPLGVSWSNTIKPYAQNVIAAIRAIDVDNLIVVGTPRWSQDVDIASRDPLQNVENVAYSLHFYAASHGESLRNQARTAMNNGIALFVTEWGAVRANGDGHVDVRKTEAWMDYLNENNISHVNWAVSDATEGASIVTNKASSHGGWQESDLTESGRYVKSIITTWRNRRHTRKGQLTTPKRPVVTINPQ